jgi:hypothetical protein
MWLLKKDEKIISSQVFDWLMFGIGSYIFNFDLAKVFVFNLSRVKAK